MTRLPVAVLLLSCLVSPALADGMFLPGPDFSAMRPSSAAQKGIMIREGTDEVLLLQTTYHGPADRFAWVVPVPSKPSEMFPAEPAFVTETFKGTEPVVVTRFNRPGYTVPTASGSLPAAPGAAGPPPPVQVLEEKDVGNYHAVVLAATRGDELQKWLGKNQYHLPTEAQPVLDDYVRRGWVFVALKMQEKRARAQGVLTEVAPLGLRFKCPAEGLVYPLTVSRVSAPPLTALLLCVIADEPYTCKTIPAVWLTEKVTLRRNETYGDLRRKMTRNPTRLLCESSGNPPFQYTNLGYRASDWEQGRDNDFSTRKCSRFLGLVAPEEMVDLSFAPDADPTHADYRVLVRRTARAVPSRTSGALLRIGVLRPGSEAQAAALSGKPLQPPTQRKRDDSWRVPVAVMLGFLTATVLILRWALVGAKVIAPLLALGLVVGVAQGGMPGFELLGTLQTAVDLFQADTGCLPATVADLAARKQPPKGLDASGNEAEIKGWRGPYLGATPPNPIRGGKLVIDPLNAFVLDSTGFSSTCEPATYAVAREARGGKAPWMRPYWKTSPADATQQMKPYHEWLRKHQGHRLFAFETSSTSLSYGTEEAIVVDRDERRYFTLPGRRLWLGPRGQVLTGYDRRSEESDSYLWNGPENGSFCGVTDAHSAFRPLPQPRKHAVPIALAPDGSALAEGMGELVVLRPDGSQRSYAVEGYHFDRASFSRDGRSVYLVKPLLHARSSMEISRLDLRSGTVKSLDTGTDDKLMAVGLDGVLYMKDLSLWHVAGGNPRQLLSSFPEQPDALALAQDCAYWAHESWENTIYRVSLQGGQSKPVATIEHGEVIMAADGADLYVVYQTYQKAAKLMLLAGGKTPLRLGEWPASATPPNLPDLD